MDGSLLLKEVLKAVDVKKLISGILVGQVIKPALLDLVAKSENKLDDAAVAMLLPLAEKAVDDLLTKLLADLGK